MPSVASKLAVELQHISRVHNGRVPIVSGRGVCTISLGNQLLVQEVRRWQPYYFSLHGPGCNALKKEVQLLLIGWAETQGLVFIFRSEDGTFHEMSNEAKRDKVARLLGERPRVNNIDIPPPPPSPPPPQPPLMVIDDQDTESAASVSSTNAPPSHTDINSQRPFPDEDESSIGTEALEVDTTTLQVLMNMDDDSVPSISDGSTSVPDHIVAPTFWMNSHHEDDNDADNDNMSVVSFQDE